MREDLFCLANTALCEPPTTYLRSAIMKMAAAAKKIEKVMGEYGKGKLHSGSKKGPVVKNPRQAIAIALSAAGKSKPMKRGK